MENLILLYHSCEAIIVENIIKMIWSSSQMFLEQDVSYIFECSDSEFN